MNTQNRITKGADLISPVERVQGESYTFPFLGGPCCDCRKSPEDGVRTFSFSMDTNEDIYSLCKSCMFKMALETDVPLAHVDDFFKPLDTEMNTAKFVFTCLDTPSFDSSNINPRWLQIWCVQTGVKYTQVLTYLNRILKDNGKPSFVKFIELKHPRPKTGTTDNTDSLNSHNITNTQVSKPMIQEGHLTNESKEGEQP